MTFTSNIRRRPVRLSEVNSVVPSAWASKLDSHYILHTQDPTFYLLPPTTAGSNTRLLHTTIPSRLCYKMMFPMSHAGVPDLTLQKLSRDQEPLMPMKSSPAPRATSHDDENDANDASETSDPMEEKEVSLTTTSPEPPQGSPTPPPSKQKRRSGRNTTGIKTAKPKPRSPATPLSTFKF